MSEILKVAILGTGMASFVAAQAVSQHNPENQIVLYGPNRRPSAMGARWYERQIPGVDVVSHVIKTESAGTPDGYVRKLDGPISAYFRVRNNFLAYNYNDAHELLWERFQDRIREIDFDYELINNTNWQPYDFVINTLPRPTFYPREDRSMFAATRHWRCDEMSDGTTNPFVMPGNQDKNLIIFDGTEESSWFRISQMFGLMSVEWGFHKKPPIQDMFVEILPLGVPVGTNLRYLTPSWRDTVALAHVGALARWEPSTDVAEVYEQVTDVISHNWTEMLNHDNDSGRRNSVTEESPFKEEEKGN